MLILLSIAVDPDSLFMGQYNVVRLSDLVILLANVNNMYITEKGEH